jgi:uncharacterized membrane protein YdjX (TVP38/TMEM64 family)
MLTKEKFFLSKTVIFFLLFTFLPFVGGAVMSYFGLAEGKMLSEADILLQMCIFLLISLFTGLGFFPASAGAIVFFGALGNIGLPVAIFSYFLSLCVSVYVKKFLTARFASQIFTGAENLSLAIQKRGLRLVIFCRLSPILPFPAMNFALLSADIPLRTYLLGSMLGMLPRLFFTGLLTVSLSNALNNQFSTQNLIFLFIGLTGFAGMLYEGKKIAGEAGLLKKNNPK